MANQRDPNQKFLGVWMDKELMQLVDSGRVRVGKQRAQFVREAIVEKLQELGYDIELDIAMPPDRTGAKQEADEQNTNSKSLSQESRANVDSALKEAAEKLAQHAKEKVAARRAQRKKANT